MAFRIDWFDLHVVEGNLESSLAPQFERISSSVLSFPYGLHLTTVHDYWKNHRKTYIINVQTEIL